MTVTYEDVIPSIIENTVMKKMFIDGEHRVFTIAPIEGYVLHDNDFDMYYDFDANGNPVGELVLGYGRGTVTCGANYDFTANPREFYSVPENSVPADQIFGGVNNDHEIA